MCVFFLLVSSRAHQRDILFIVDIYFVCLEVSAIYNNVYVGNCDMYTRLFFPLRLSPFPLLYLPLRLPCCSIDNKYNRSLWYNKSAIGGSNYRYQRKEVSLVRKLFSGCLPENGFVGNKLSLPFQIIHENLTSNRSRTNILTIPLPSLHLMKPLITIRDVFTFAYYSQVESSFATIL